MNAKERQKIPPIDELRQICQSEKLADKRLWYVWYRWLSIYITRLFLYTNITANQVSFLSLFFMVVGCVLIVFQSPWAALIGYILLLVYHFLDKVDGEIARYRKVFSICGVYIDELAHRWVSVGLFLATTIRIAPKSEYSNLVWILGFTAAVSNLLLRLGKSVSFQLFTQYVMDKPELLHDVKKSESVLSRQFIHAERYGGNHRLKFLQRLFSLVGKQFLIWTQYLVGLWVFLVAIIIELITGNRTLFVWIIIFEGIFQVTAYLSLVVINLKFNVADECLRIQNKVLEMPHRTKK